jgi:hypothetical protein
MQSLAGTYGEAISEMKQLRGLNLAEFLLLSAQQVKDHICCLAGIERLGLLYDFDSDAEPPDEWDSETQYYVDVPYEDVPSAVARSMPGLRSFTLNAYDEIVECQVLPWIEGNSGLLHLQHLAFVYEEPPEDAQGTWQLLDRLAAARPGLQCTWQAFGAGYIRAPFVGEL